jgi:hypothetical protein
VRKLASLGVVIVLLSGVLSAQKIGNGEDLLRAMHDRYAESWYHTLTFTQKSTTYKPDGTAKVETWYEALMLPAKLRINFGPPSDGNGALMVNENVWVFQEGKLTSKRPYVNMLLVLGFDVYGQPAERTIEVVKSEAFDLTKLHEDTWEGKPAYVVGADKGDLSSKQFWVDKDRLLFLRVIQPDRSDPKKMEDIRFADYRRLAGGWVAAYVEVNAEGKKIFSESYSDIEANPKLDPSLFDPDQFTAQRTPQ